MFHPLWNVFDIFVFILKPNASSSFIPKDSAHNCHVRCSLFKKEPTPVIKSEVTFYLPKVLLFEYSHAQLFAIMNPNSFRCIVQYRIIGELKIWPKQDKCSNPKAKVLCITSWTKSTDFLATADDLADHMAGHSFGHHWVGGMISKTFDMTRWPGHQPKNPRIRTQEWEVAGSIPHCSAIDIFHSILHDWVIQRLL